MKNFVKLLSHPLLHLFVGLLLYLFVGCGIWNLGSIFEPRSAFYGGLVVIAIDIFDYGVQFFVRKKSNYR